MTVLSPTMQTLIGQGVSGVRFSVTSPPIVPGLQYVWQQPQLAFGKLRDIPTQHFRFQELCVSDSDYSVPTIWGEVEGEIYNEYVGTELFESVSFEAFPGSGENSFIYKTEHFVADQTVLEKTDVSGKYATIGNELCYTSAVSLFAIGQSSLMHTMCCGDENIIPYKAEIDATEASHLYTSSFAIAFGMELLKAVGKKKAADEDPRWEIIMGSMKGDVVTPLTAYLIADLLTMQLHDQPEMALEELEFYEYVGDDNRDCWQLRERPLGLNRIEDDTDMSLIEDKPIWMHSPKTIGSDFFESKLFFGGRPPAISAYYIPPGNYGEFWKAINVALRVFGFVPDFPTIVIAQNMSIYDNKPFAPLFVDLMAAAKILQPALPYDPT